MPHPLVGRKKDRHGFAVVFVVTDDDARRLPHIGV